MPTIDLGVNFDDVQDMDKFPVVPNGTYNFMIKSGEQVKCGPNAKSPGRPMIKWSLEIVDPDTHKPFNLFYNTVLPWTPPGATELDISGVGMLVSLCKGVNNPWTGALFAPEDYLGLTGLAKISQKTKQVLVNGQYVNDPNGEQTNNVDGFEY